MAEIRLAGLEKRYGAVAALRGITLTVQDGELVALLGPSGCGKTTTLQILAGFLIPDGGEVWAGDRLISSPKGAVPPERSWNGATSTRRVESHSTLMSARSIAIG